MNKKKRQLKDDRKQKELGRENNIKNERIKKKQKNMKIIDLKIMYNINRNNKIKSEKK